MMSIEEFMSDLQSFSAHSLDLKMKSYLPFLNGVFVECGAYDGLTQSNTLIYERFAGWTGILVEPSHDRYLECVNNRPNSVVFNCCLVSNSYKEQTVKGDFNGTLMSSINGERLKMLAQEGEPKSPKDDLIEVEARTLQSIFDQIGIQSINYMSIDVEGYEREVLSGIDLEKTKVDYILVESDPNKLDLLCDQLRKTHFLVATMNNFNNKEHSGWDGTHDDYLFARI